MPTTTAVPVTGLGITLTVNSVAIYAVTKISPPEVSADTAETSTLASTWKTFISGLIDGGEVTGTVNYDYSDSTQAALPAMLGGAAQPCVITFKNAKTMTFSGLLVKFKVNDITGSDVVSADFTLKVTGPVVWA